MMDVATISAYAYNLNGLEVQDFTLLGFMNGLTEETGVLIRGILMALVVLTLTACLIPSWYYMPRLAYLFAFLVSFIGGSLIKNYIPNESYYASTTQTAASSLLKGIIPLLVFHSTLRIDYHTLGRVIGSVLFISACLFGVNVGMLFLIMYSVEGGYDKAFNLLHALNLSVVSSTYSVSMLDKAQTQVRQLQILLQGEMLVSIALYRFLEAVLLKYTDLNHAETVAPTTDGVLVFALWNFAGIFLGMFASYLFRQFVNYAYDDGVGQGVCCLSFNVVLYSLCDVLGTNSTLCILAFGICLGTSKIKFNNRTAEFYHNSHDLNHHILCTIVFAYCGYWLGRSPNWSSYFDGAYVSIIFTACLVSRMVTFILIHRVVAKLNLQINWRHLTIAVQGAARGGLFLAFSLTYLVSYKFKEGERILAYNSILTCLSYIANLALLGPLFGAIGMYDLTRAKIVNMNLAVSQVNECRGRAIQALKVDRVIADANWMVVEETTKLQHPYKKSDRTIFAEEDDEFEGKGQSRIVYCGECGAKGTAPLSKQELEDVCLDIKHRILKAQRVSFYRQHDNGTLSRHGVKILSNLVEKVLVREDPILTARDLKIQRDGSPKMQCMKTMFRHLFTITSKKHAFIPTFWLRAFCFRVCTSRKYQITMACFSMIDLMFLVRFLHLFYSGKSTSSDVRFLQILDFAFYSLFVLEFIIEILGIGVIQYFLSPVNQIEFSCSCLIRSLEIGAFLNFCYNSGRFENVLTADPVIMYLKTMLLLRVTRIYIFIVALIPKLLNLVDKKMDEDLVKIYDIGKIYLITQEQVIKFLGHLVTNEEVYNKIGNVLESDRLAVAYELGLISFDRATIAATNKTGHAIRNVVNTMSDCIARMKDEEYLDPVETSALLSSLEKVKNRARNLSFIEPQEPQMIVAEIPWLKGEIQTLNFFLKHARISSYCKHELIFSNGDDPIGLFIIIEGLVKVTYVPSPEILEMNATYGVLPNFDFFNNLKFVSPQNEYVTINAIIGEIGLITGRKYNMTAVCETSVHLLWFPMKILRAVIRDSGNAVIYQAAIWKSIGIKVGINVLQDTSQFRSWSREKLFMYLQSGVVPLLKGVQSVYIGEHVEDVILIEGTAMDYATRLTYTAPYYIPRTVATLLLPPSPLMDKKTPFETRLFVIPNFHSDAEDVSGPEGLFKEYIQQMEMESADKDAAVKLNASSRSTSNSKIECKRGHGRTKMSAYTRKVLKAQRKTLRAIKFMEYIPTVNGPIERNLTSTTFLLGSEKKKNISQTLYPKSKYYDPSFGYMGDVAENSEIREIRGNDEEDDDETEGKRFKVRRSQSGTTGKRSRQLSSISSMSSSRLTMDTDGSIIKTHTEILVIESSEEDLEKFESKEVQTTIHMRQAVRSSSDMRPSRSVSVATTESREFPPSRASSVLHDDDER